MSASPPASAVRASQPPIWITALLALTPAVALGLGRFAYALLLPTMRADLGWSYAEAGAMNAANAVGYLLGAMAASPLHQRMGTRRVLVGALLGTAGTLLACAVAEAFLLLILFRFAAGVFGAVAFVVGGGIAAAIGRAGRASVVLGLYFCGGGVGIALSAWVIPGALAAHGWPGGWAVLGVLALAMTALLIPALMRAPLPSRRQPGTGEAWSVRPLIPTFISYALYGVGYIAYMTFIIAYLRDSVHLRSNEIEILWTILGLATVVGAFAWAPVLQRLRAGWPLAATLAVVSIGSLLPLIARSPALAYLSAALFGCSFLAVVAAATDLARRSVPPYAWTAVIGLLTVAFGVGQCIGPLLSGAVSDGKSGLAAGLGLSGAILVLATLVALFQRAAKEVPDP